MCVPWITLSERREMEEKFHKTRETDLLLSQMQTQQVRRFASVLSGRAGMRSAPSSASDQKVTKSPTEGCARHRHRAALCEGG